MDPSFRTNPMLSFWLSSANAWAGALRGFWMAEWQRQQAAFLTQAARQATLFWTGGLPRAEARDAAAAPPTPAPAAVPPGTPLAALRVIEGQPGTPPEAGPDLKAPAPAPSALIATADDVPEPKPAARPAPEPEPEARPKGSRALASRAERRSGGRSPGKRRPH